MAPPKLGRRPDQMTNPTAFEAGKTYSTRSLCDYDCIFRFSIVRRTAKTITFTYHGQEQTRGVRIRDGVERCLPLGRFSMAPTITADRLEA
jgi:hypothetical protein